MPLRLCFDEAGERYRISPQLLWAIAKTESNFSATAVNHNNNGSFDYGVMQINSSWYRELRVPIDGCTYATPVTTSR
ncbi:MAG: Transglycosylase SLT domain protein [Syntrophorhabdaceae bacterium PtaU1.Bin034]|jgi:soluble lytic murein transglycosylase-like protein|nr:MAG: Transglycosylase SLT domain protein [Syntrophorhabdaceae bacterium PtaU1.Bin034]